jgi:uncharacterized tellurite resistance protein B-like protein
LPAGRADRYDTRVASQSMPLPATLAEAFTRETGHPPGQVARALYPLDGGLGEAYVAGAPDRLMVFSKKLGGSWRTHLLPFAGIENFSLLADGSFCQLDVDASSRRHTLKFSGWDRPARDQLSALWAAATGRSVRVGRDAARAVPLTPLTLFCAVLHAAMRHDDDPSVPEELFLARAITDPQGIQDGLTYWEQHGTEETIAAARAGLNPDQRWCALANATALVMADGKLTAAEQDFLEHVRAEWQVPAEDFARIQQVLFCRNNLGVFLAADGQVAAEALTAFHAALLAMGKADGEAGECELAMIRALAAGADPVEAAQGALADGGVDGLLARLPALLTPEQSCCLYANLLALAMADGALRSRELALLERIRESLRLAADTAELVHATLFRQHNLAVLGAA